MARKPNGKPARFFFDLAVFLLGFFLLVPTLSAQPTAPEPAATDANSGLVRVIPIIGTIDEGLSFFLQRMIRKAERDQVKVLVLEINSNGGLVTAAQEMKDALLNTRLTTVAYVRGRALSAAALVAISSSKIIMEPGSEMGAATPIMLMGSGVKAAEAKFVSAFRGEFEAAAEARKRPKALAGAMVDKDHDTIPNLVKRGEILTLTAETANEHGFCDVIATSLQYGLSRLKINPTPLERVEPTSGEAIARWLTDPNISVILFTVGVWSLILEFVIFGGWGLLGWFGLLCLGLFFGGHLFAYMAGMEALILFIAGIAMLVLEAFVIPGFGITGVLGIISICMSVVIVFGGIYTAIWAIAKIMALSIIMITALFYIAPKMHLFDRLILKDQLTTEQGYVAVDVNQYNHLLNLEGVTMSPCRPSGFARLGTDRVEVVSEGDFIEKGTRVTVIAVEGTKVVVRALNS